MADSTPMSSSVDEQPQQENQPGDQLTQPPGAQPAEDQSTEPAEATSNEPPRGQEEESEEEPDDGVPIVLVTGASGYIAQHVIKLLLEQERFRVRGSVRNKKREDKVKPLLNIVPNARYPLRLVEADLQNADSWNKAVKRCSYVFHIASPIVVEIPKNENELIVPAVEGTVNVLQACVNAGTVKRVVLTSSVAAVSSGMIGNPGNPPDYVYTEKDWSDEAICPPYEKSKLKAEQAAWDFMKKLDEDKRFELVVMNPVLVQGPILTPVGGAASMEVCKFLLTGAMPLIPDNSFGVVDVRDVAAAHIAGLMKPEAAGNRYLLNSSTVHMREMAQIMSEEFGAQGYKPPTKNMPNAALWLLKWFSAAAKILYLNRGKSLVWSNERMIGELGVEPRAIKDTIIDTCYSAIENGLVKKTPGYLGPRETRPKPTNQNQESEQIAEGDTKSDLDQGKISDAEDKETKPEEIKPEEKKPEEETTEEIKPEEEKAEENKPEENKPEEEKAEENKPEEEKPKEIKAEENKPEEKPEEEERKPEESESAEG